MVKMAAQRILEKMAEIRAKSRLPSAKTVERYHGILQFRASKPDIFRLDLPLVQPQHPFGACAT